MTEKSKKEFCEDHMKCQEYKGFACCDCLADAVVFECKFDEVADAKDHCTSFRPLIK